MIAPISDRIELSVGPGWVLALTYALEPLGERHSRATLTVELLAATVPCLHAALARLTSDVEA